MTFSSLEQFLCEFILAAAGKSMHKLPMNWYGTYNALSLYCDHPHYSPFLPLPKFADGRLMVTEVEREELIKKLINRGLPDYF